MFIISQVLFSKLNICLDSNIVTYSIITGLVIYALIYFYLLFYNGDMLSIFNKFIIYIIGLDLLLSTFYQFSPNLHQGDIDDNDDDDNDTDDTQDSQIIIESIESINDIVHDNEITPEQEQELFITKEIEEIEEIKEIKEIEEIEEIDKVEEIKPKKRGGRKKSSS